MIIITLINDTTNVTSCCFETYEEIKDIHECSTIYMKYDNYYKRDTTGKQLITAFQLFKILNLLLINWLPQYCLTEELMNTHVYEQVVYRFILY